MSRLCERPGCAEPATVAYGFDPAERMVWFASRRDDGMTAGGLCRRHADAMVLPRGWWLDDRRGGDDALFEAAGVPEPAPVTPAPKAKPRRSRKPKGPDQPLPGATSATAAPADAPTLAAAQAGDEGEPAAHTGEAGEPSPAAGADAGAPGAEAGAAGPAAGAGAQASAAGLAEPEAEAAWTPAFDAADDLGGQLQAATPLLSRAFGSGTTLPPTPSRSRKKQSPGPVG